MNCYKAKFYSDEFNRLNFKYETLIYFNIKAFDKSLVQSK